MDERIPALEKLRKANQRLQESLLVPVSPVVQDGVIQRFEFTFELSWKTLKIFLREQGIEVYTPKETLKAAFRARWIGEEKDFLTMLEDRNATSHIYDDQEALLIYQRIQSFHTDNLRKLLTHLEQLAKETPIKSDPADS